MWSSVRNTIFVVLSVGVIALAGITGLQAAQNSSPGINQLVMITSSHCPWCEAFEEEVGEGYGRTPEARYLPLRRIDIDDAIPQDIAIKSPASFTPTFIIIQDNQEIARIEGYPGAELFWWRLSEFIPQNQ